MQKSSNNNLQMRGNLQTLSEKRDRLTVEIRRKLRETSRTKRRQENRKGLEMFLKENYDNTYLQTAVDLYHNPLDETVIKPLFKNIKSLEASASKCTKDNWGYFAYILQIMLEFQDQNLKDLLHCIQIVLSKGFLFMKESGTQYPEFIKKLVSFIKSFIAKFFVLIKQECVTIIESVLFDIFRSFDTEWQSQIILEDSLDIINFVMIVKDNFDINQIQNEMMEVKERKFKFINIIFYNEKAIFLNKMMEIMESSCYSQCSSQIPEKIIRILIRLTFWAQSSTFTEPLVQLNIYQYAYSLWKTKPEAEMNGLLVQLIHNLLILDARIAIIGWNDKIIERLVDDIINQKQNIHLQYHVSCLTNFVLELDEDIVDINQQFNLNKNLSNLINTMFETIDNKDFSEFLSCVSSTIHASKVVLSPCHILELQKLFMSVKDQDIMKQIQQILQISQVYMEE